MGFYEVPPSAISYRVTDHVLYGVDAESEDVVGLQIDGFLAHFVYEAPIFLELADLIGLTPSEVAEIRSRLAPIDHERAALRAVLVSIASERLARHPVALFPLHGYPVSGLANVRRARH